MTGNFPEANRLPQPKRITYPNPDKYIDKVMLGIIAHEHARLQNEIFVAAHVFSLTKCVLG